MTTHKICFDYDLGERVVIDSGDVNGVITGASIQSGGIIRYLVSWIHAGVLYEHWIDEFRLTSK